MSLDRLWQLDPTTATSNSNFAGANIAENCAPSGINNALRALGVMVARDLAFQASAISSSVSTNIVTSSTGLYVPITGANAINSFGVVPNEQPSAAVFRILEFSSSASISHGGSIFLSGGASRKTQPGDVMGVIHEGSGDQWRELFYSRADGALPADSISVTTITNRSMSTSAISTVTLNAASASITALAFTTINATSVSASVGDFTILRASGARVMGPLMHIRDEKASGTDGGTSTGGAWTKHTLDDVKTNEISGASVAASVISLQPGSYYAEGWIVTQDDNGGKARLRQVSSLSATVLVGASLVASAVDATSSLNAISGRFSLSNSASLEFQYFVNAGSATTGLGAAVTSGEVEVYADLLIWKL